MTLCSAPLPAARAASGGVDTGPSSAGWPLVLERLVGTDADFLVRFTPDGRVLGVSENVVSVLGWDLARTAAEGVRALPRELRPARGARAG